MSNEENNIDESIFIGKILSLMAVGATQSLEKFSGWLLAGFGVAFTLILSNIDSVQKFIDTSNIKCGITLYLIALGAGVIQRWLASGIHAGEAVAKDAEKLGKDSSENINPENLLNEIENVTLYPQKWFVQWQFNKVRQGDFAANGRMQARMAQVQGYLVLIQGVLAISSIVVLVRGLGA